MTKALVGSKASSQRRVEPLLDSLVAVVLPQMYHAVPAGPDGATHPKVSGPILLDLSEPPFAVVLWWPKACGATVPETAIHKDDNLFLAKNQIRRTRQTANIASKTDPLTA